MILAVSMLVLSGTSWSEPALAPSGSGWLAAWHYGEAIELARLNARAVVTWRSQIAAKKATSLQVLALPKGHAVLWVDSGVLHLATVGPKEALGAPVVLGDASMARAVWNGAELWVVREAHSTALFFARFDGSGKPLGEAKELRRASVYYMTYLALAWTGTEAWLLVTPVPPDAPYAGDLELARLPEEDRGTVIAEGDAGSSPDGADLAWTGAGLLISYRQSGTACVVSTAPPPSKLGAERCGFDMKFAAHTALAWSGKQAGLLIAGEPEVRFVRLSAAGEPIGPSVGLGEKAYQAAIAAGGGGWAALWANDSGVKARVVSADGKLGPAVRLSPK